MFQDKVLLDTLKSFKGMCHCETLLICLYPISKLHSSLQDPDVSKANVLSDVFHLLLPQRR